MEKKIRIKDLQVGDVFEMYALDRLAYRIADGKIFYQVVNGKVRNNPDTIGRNSNQIVLLKKRANASNRKQESDCKEEVNAV
jgi:hypothetical protein